MALLDVEAGFWALRRQMEALVGSRLTDSVLQQAGANGGASFARAFVAELPALRGRQALRDCVAAYQAAGFGRFEVETLEWPIGRALIRGTDTFEAWMVRQHREFSEAPACAYSAGVLVGFVNALAGRTDIVCVKRACQAQGAEACLFELVSAKAAEDVPVIAYDPDPALGRQLNLLELLFDRMPMGIAILDREYRIRRYNPTWEDFAARYVPPSVAPLSPGAYYFDHFPGSKAVTVPMLERVLANETIRGDALRFESGGIVSYWDIVLAPLVEDGEVAGILNVTVDATERVEAHQHLEQRVEERTRELATLLEVSHNVNSMLELEPLLGLILDELKNVVDYDGSTILTVEGEYLVVKAYRGPIPQYKAVGMRFSIDDPLDRRVILGRKPVVIRDTRGDSDAAQSFRESVGEDLDTTFGHIRSWLGVPLVVKDRVIGQLALEHGQPDRYASQQAELVMAFANQAAVAIENAKLYAHAEEAAVAAERSRLARDLHDAVTQTLFSSSLIAEVLPRLWERDPEEGRRRLQELRELTRGALAEMRTLLLELRPSALAEARLGDLLRQLAESISGRARVPVAFEVEAECEPPVDVKVALYRIAQEALNNVAKHAGATQATVSLRYLPSRTEEVEPQIGVELVIRDDGIGFSPSRIASNSLGLGIMRERAEAIGAALAIDSQPGGGTQIEVLWRSSVQ
jgi:two-component system nitrate/nitrite sensor histidine kinase NarX